MRPLRYSINVTLDGGCDHRVMIADEDSHRYWAATLDRADALLFGRVTYEMMEAAWRGPARTGARPDWTVPFACSIASRALSGTLGRRPAGPRVRNAAAPVDIVSGYATGWRLPPRRPARGRPRPGSDLGEQFGGAFPAGLAGGAVR
jgi:hypothetical protein